MHGTHERTLMSIFHDRVKDLHWKDFPFKEDLPSLSPRSIELTNQNASIGFAFSISLESSYAPQKEGWRGKGLGEYICPPPTLLASKTLPRNSGSALSIFSTLLKFDDLEEENECKNVFIERWTWQASLVKGTQK